MPTSSWIGNRMVDGRVRGQRRRKLTQRSDEEEEGERARTRRRPTHTPNQSYRRDPVLLSSAMGPAWASHSSGGWSDPRHRCSH